MKYLLMCEGPNELEIIRILLEHDKLIFRSDDLLNRVLITQDRSRHQERSKRHSICIPERWLC